MYVEIVGMQATSVCIFECHSFNICAYFSAARQSSMPMSSRPAASSAFPYATGSAVPSSQSSQSVYPDYYSSQMMAHRLTANDSMVPQNVTVSSKPPSSASVSNSGGQMP